MISIEIEGLPDERNFNNSVCEFDGKLVMAYRAEDQDRGVLPHIRIVTLGPDFRPMTYSRKIDFSIFDRMFEDPRLFEHAGAPWLSFIVAVYRGGRHYAAQGIAKLDEDFKPTKIFYPSVGDNINEASFGNGILNWEKNWTFFSHENRIHVIYSINPLKVGVMDEDTGEIEFLPETKIKPNWKHGDIHGGTTLVNSQGMLVGCFHSFTRSNVRNYHCGFYAIDPKPWRVALISDSPWMSAAYDDSRDKRPKTQSWRPNVVFPCGMIERGDDFLISYGWQDCRSMLVTVPRNVVWNSLRPVKQHFHEVERYRDFSIAPPGGFKVKIGESEVRARGWQSLKREASKFQVNERDLEDAIVKVVPASHKRTEWAEIK